MKILNLLTIATSLIALMIFPDLSMAAGGEKLSQDNDQITASTAQELLDNQARAQAQIDSKNTSLITTSTGNTGESDKKQPSLTSIVINYNFQKPSTLNSEDLLNINEAYSGGEKGVATSIAFIRLENENGERLTRNEVGTVIDSLQSAPGTDTAPFWKRWDDVTARDGKYYWRNAPQYERELNGVEAQLYAQWKTTPLASSLYSTILSGYGIEKMGNLTLEEIMEIKQAYKNGMNSAATSAGMINFNKQNGERLDRDEFDMLLNSLQSIPGSNTAPYWKTWDNVNMVDGKYYWQYDTSNKKEMNNIDVQLYLKRKNLIK